MKYEVDYKIVTTDYDTMIVDATSVDEASAYVEEQGKELYQTDEVSIEMVREVHVAN